MNELEAFRKLGFAFAIWLTAGGYIIQGTVEGHGADWDFEVSGNTFDEACAKATFESRSLMAKALRSNAKRMRK